MLIRVALAIAAVCAHDLLLPADYSPRPLFTLLAFGALVAVRNGGEERELPPLSRVRTLLFVAFHVVLAVIGFTGHAQTIGAASTLVPVNKMLVLPSVLLFPVDRAFVKRYGTEIAATAIVFLAFFPTRYMHMIWPWYSNVLTSALNSLCGVLVPGTHLATEGGDAIVAGPAVNMIVGFECSGIEGINLFHFVFGIVVIAEWNRLRKSRALICFFVGGIAYLGTNILRLVALFFIGNRVSPSINLDFLGWVLFGVVFYILIKSTYGWMIPRQDATEPAGALNQAA